MDGPQRGDSQAPRSHTATKCLALLQGSPSGREWAPVTPDHGQWELRHQLAS